MTDSKPDKNVCRTRYVEALGEYYCEVHHSGCARQSPTCELAKLLVRVASLERTRAGQQPNWKMQTRGRERQ